MRAPHAIDDLTAYEAHDGSWEAVLFGPGASTAYRDRRGIWTSPAPPITGRELLASFTRLDLAAATELNREAVRALVGPEAQQARLMPDQLMRAAKDYSRRCDEAKVLRMTLQVLQRVSEQALAASKRKAE